MVLRAHAAITNYNKPKIFHTKPVITRPKQRPTENPKKEAENDQNTINMKPEPVETDEAEDTETEPVETDTKEKVIGTFVTKTVGIRKYKKE